MLEDRDYMRQPDYLPRLSLTAVLLVVNAIVFLVECLTSANPARLEPASPFFYQCFALSVEGLKHGFVWQLFTYQFMHAGLLHLLLNSWAIYVFGRAIEKTIGRGKYLALFLTSGVVGGIFQVLVALLWPGLFGGPVVGASAGAFGLVAAFAVLFPERELTLLLFFIIPIRLSAKMLLIVSLTLAVAGIVGNIISSNSIFSGNIAHAAHLGGMLAGMIFVRRFVRDHGWELDQPLRRSGAGEFIARWAGKSPLWRSGADEPDEELSTDEFVKSEVDPILDKISRQGIQSLTAREREILEKARERMAKH
jgi:membrane associated rhomboid family serine protease